MPEENSVPAPVTPAATPVSQPTPAPAAAPIVLEASDLKPSAPAMPPTVLPTTPAAPAPTPPATGVEVLTGEPTAAQPKVEQLVTNVQPTVQPSAPVMPAPVVEAPKPVVAPAEPAAQPVSPLSSKPELPPIATVEPTPTTTAATPSVPAEPVKPLTEPATSVVTPAQTPAPATPVAPKPELPINDIYPTAKMPEAPQMAPSNGTVPMPAEGAEHQESILGAIGEVVGTIGLTALLLMILSPLYKGVFSSSIWDAIKLIGWLLSVSTLFIGFIFALFAPRKITLKALLFLGLIISLILFLGVDGSAAMTAKLDTYFGQYLSYFR